MKNRASQNHRRSSIPECDNDSCYIHQAPSDLYTSRSSNTLQLITTRMRELVQTRKVGLKATKKTTNGLILRENTGYLS